MPGRVRAEIVEAHGIAAGIERMELHEAGPGFVEQDVVAEVADLLDDHAGVVDRAVVGALLDDGDAERPLAAPRFLVGDQRVIADLLADARLVERLVEDRADQPVRVAVGLEKDGDSAAEEQRAMMRRLVVVAVEQHQIAFGDQRGKHHLVGCGRAVQDEVGLFGTEDLGRLLLRLQGRALVDQQVAELEHGIVEVVAEDRLAEMLDENAADRAAIVEHPAVVARAGPELVAALGVVDQRTEERRFQRLGILLEPAHQVLGDKRRRLFGEEDVAVDVVEHLDRDVFQPLAADQHDDRHFQPTPPHQVDQRRGLALQSLLAPVDHHAADGGVGLDGDLGILGPPCLDDLEAELLDFDDDLAQPVAFEVVGIKGRCGNEKREAPEEVHRSHPMTLVFQYCGRHPGESGTRTRAARSCQTAAASTQAATAKKAMR